MALLEKINKISWVNHLSNLKSTLTDFLNVTDTLENRVDALETSSENADSISLGDAETTSDNFLTVFHEPEPNALNFKSTNLNGNYCQVRANPDMIHLVKESVGNPGEVYQTQLLSTANEVELKALEIDGDSNIFSTSIVLTPFRVNILGTGSFGNREIRLFLDNLTTNVNMRVASASGTLPSLNTTAPASATATGSVGEIRVTSTFIYTCIAPNTWVRGSMASW